MKTLKFTYFIRKYTLMHISIMAILFLLLCMQTIAQPVPVNCGDTITFHNTMNPYGDGDQYVCPGSGGSLTAQGPENIYHFSITSQQTITAAITNLPSAGAANFTHIFIVNCNEINDTTGINTIACGTSGDPAIAYCLDPGSYCIVIDYSTNNYPGNYSFTLNCLPCNLCGDTITVHNTMNPYGDGDSYSCPDGGSLIVASGPENVYHFSITSQQTVEATITNLPSAGASGFTHIFILDCNEVNDTTGITTLACGTYTDPAVATCLPPGDYCVVLDYSTNNYPGNYSFTLNCLPCNLCGDTITVHNTMNPYGDGDSYSCPGGGSPIAASGPENVYHFTITSTQTIEAAITALPSGGATNFTHIFILNCNEINDTTGINTLACGTYGSPAVATCLNPGDYCVVLDYSTNNYPGNYTFTLNCLPCYDTIINCGDTLTGHYPLNSPSDNLYLCPDSSMIGLNFGEYEHVYLLRLTSDSYVTATIDPNMPAFAADWVNIVVAPEWFGDTLSVFACGDSAHPAVTGCLGAGDYFVYLTFGTNNIPGIYSFTTSCTPCQSNITQHPTGNTGLMIYPNPAEDKINIEIPGQHQNSEYLIMDVRGRTVLSGASSGSRYQVDVSGISKGLYILSVTAGSERYYGKFCRN